MRPLYLILVFVSCFLISEGQSSPFWGELKPGKYPIGFKVIQKYDSSRQFVLEKQQDTVLINRPMQLCFWFPAQKVMGSKKMQCRNYFQLQFNEEDFTQVLSIDSQWEAFLEWLGRYGASQADILRMMNSETGAFQNVAPKKGAFPLIIFVQGGGRPAHSAFILCEYLASHGFVVATMPAIRNPADPRSGLQQIQDQVQDISFIQDFVHTQFNVNEKLGLISFSTGIYASLLYQMKNQNAQLLISLDGVPKEEVLKTSPYYAVNHISKPLCVFQSNHGGRLSREEALKKADPLFFLNQTPKYYLRMMELNHPELLSIGMLQATVGARLIRFEAIGDIQSSHELLCRQIKHLAYFFMKKSKVPSSNNGMHSKLYKHENRKIAFRYFQ